MTDLLGVRDGVMRPLTVDAFERWLRSDDVERDVVLLRDVRARFPF